MEIFLTEYAGVCVGVKKGDQDCPQDCGRVTGTDLCLA